MECKKTKLCKKILQFVIKYLNNLNLYVGLKIFFYFFNHWSSLINHNFHSCLGNQIFHFWFICKSTRMFPFALIIYYFEFSPPWSVLSHLNIFIIVPWSCWIFPLMPKSQNSNIWINSNLNLVFLLMICVLIYICAVFLFSTCLVFKL